MTKIRTKTTIRQKLDWIKKNIGRGDYSRVAEVLGCTREYISEVINKDYPRSKGLGAFTKSQIKVINRFHSHLKKKQKQLMG